MEFKSTKLFALIASLTLFLFVGNLYASESFINEPTGFRGITWGTPLSENKDEMIYVRTNMGIDIYNRKNTKMSIGKALLSKLNYGYSQNRLAIIYINTSDNKNYTLLTQELKKQFGTGPWNGTIGTVNAFGDGASIMSTQHMNILFKKIHSEIEVLSKELLKKYSNSDNESDF